MKSFDELDAQLNADRRNWGTWGYFVKHKLFNRYWWKSVWYNFEVFFNPRQKWLTKKIPRTWSDKDYIIELCLFESLIKFWEKDGEDGESSTRYQYEASYDSSCWGDKASYDARVEEYKTVYNSLKLAYEWAKNREVEEAKLAEIKDYVVYFQKEQENIDKDTEMLQLIVKYRKYMWT